MIGNCRFFSVCYVLLLSACTPSNDENAAETFAQNALEEFKCCNVSFWATGFTRTHIEGALVRSKLTASELTKRRRKGRIIEFSNYDELYLKGLTIEQLLNSKIVKFDMREITHLMSPDDNPGTGDDNSRTGDQEVNQSGEEILGNKLSRVLVDEVAINFKPSNAKSRPIVLTANHAKLLSDTMTMQFEGNVILEATKCKISSEIAVWSNVYNGLFFSESFQINHKTHKPPAFFQITDTGKCQRVRSVHDVEHIDKLDTIEDKIFESMPMPIRVIFGLFGSPTNLNGEID